MTPINVRYTVKYYSPKYKKDSYKIRVYLKNISHKRQQTESYFYYKIIEWCAKNLTNNFSVTKYRSYIIFNITKQKDKDWFLAYWCGLDKMIRTGVYNYAQ